MRLNEILIEQQLDEAPMGMLSKLGNKAMAKLGSSKAQGKLQTGEEANNLKKEFMRYLGQSRQVADPEVVVQWLKSRGYPTKGAEEEMKKPTMAQKVGGAIGTGAAAVAKGVGKAATAAADTAKDVAAGAKAGYNQAMAKDQPKATTALAASIDWSNKQAVMEALSGGQLDNVFLRAVADKYAQGGGMDKQGAGQAPAVSGQGGAGGFVAGLKSGLGITGVPKDIEAQIKKLDQKQKQQLLGLIS
jgi:hypothetical protein